MHKRPLRQTTRRSFLKTGLAGVAAIGTGNVTATILTAEKHEPHKVTCGAPQIFVDLGQIDQLENVRQLFHTAEKHPDNPVLAAGCLAIARGRNCRN